MANRPVSIVLFGNGTIGRTTLRMLREMRDIWSADSGSIVRIRGIIDSTGGVVCPEDDAFSDRTLDRIDTARSNGERLSSSAPAIGLTLRSPQEVLDVASEFSPLIVIDTAAGEAAAPFVARSVRDGNGAVFSNKASLSLPRENPDSQTLWQEAGIGGRVRYETSCGAGLPVISSIQSLINTGDEILSIEGALSGTLGAIFADVDAGMPFSAAVRSARERGFTEPDPRDDLSGLDVARKALILARTIGLERDLIDVTIENLVPHSLQAGTIETFLDGIAERDAEVGARAASARESGSTLKYVATINAHDPITVGLAAVPRTTVLGSLQGPENIISIRSTRYDGFPLTVAGPGAGAQVTAAGVVADCYSLIRQLEVS